MRERKCHICGVTSDLFQYSGFLVCGDCRYELRTGKAPSHERLPGYNPRVDPDERDMIYNGRVDE